MFRRRIHYSTVIFSSPSTGTIKIVAPICLPNPFDCALLLEVASSSSSTKLRLPSWAVARPMNYPHGSREGNTQFFTGKFATAATLLRGSASLRGGNGVGEREQIMHHCFNPMAARLVAGLKFTRKCVEFDIGFTVVI